MERYTDWDIVAGIRVGDLLVDVPPERAFDRLAAYEDTGLTPDEVADLAKKAKSGEYFDAIELAKIAMRLKEASDILTAESEGRVVLLDESAQIKAIRALFTALEHVYRSVKNNDFSFARTPDYSQSATAPIINTFEQIVCDHNEAIYIAFKSQEIAEATQKGGDQ